MTVPWDPWSTSVRKKACFLLPPTPSQPDCKLALTLEGVEDSSKEEHGHGRAAIAEEGQCPGGSKQAEESHRCQGHLPGLAVPLHHPTPPQVAVLPGHHPKDGGVEEEDEAEVATVCDVVDKEVFRIDPAPEKRQLQCLQKLCSPHICGKPKSCRRVPRTGGLWSGHPPSQCCILHSCQWLLPPPPPEQGSLEEQERAAWGGQGSLCLQAPITLQSPAPSSCNPQTPSLPSSLSSPHPTMHSFSR